MNLESNRIDLAEILELAVLRPCGSGVEDYEVDGVLPDWWSDEIGEVQGDRVQIVSPFLLDFVSTSAGLWDSADDQLVASPMFEFKERSPMQAFLAKQEGQNVLVVRNLDVVDPWLADILQASRGHLVRSEYERSHHRKVVANITADRDEARKREELKSRVLANMSHEIRTPLATILGMVDQARERAPDADTQLAAISSSAEHLLRLGNDILDLSKMQVERLELDVQTIDFQDFLSGVEQEWRLHAGEKQLSFSFVQDPSTPRWVGADEFRLRQVLSNLVGNAIKFTEEGSVKLSVHCLGRSRMRFAVEDTGAGIVEDDLPKIFEAFSQVDLSKRRKQQGAGLGLAIADRLVKLMGGGIQVTSKLGVGSCFWFEVHLPSAAPLPPPAQATQTQSLLDLRILVAEDHKTNRHILVELLESAGAQVTSVADGKDAITQWNNHAFDVVIMDCQMPVMDGLEAMSEIRKTEKASERVPILGLTAHAMETEKQQVIRAGADACITKPYERHALVGIVAELAYKSKTTTRA